MFVMVCPSCGSKKIRKVVGKGFQFVCLDCGYVGFMVEDLR